MRNSFLTKLAAMVASLALAMTVGHFLIYRGLIVPRLPGLSSVPLWWWVVAFAPELAVFIVFGFWLRTWREISIFSLTAAFAHQVFRYLLVTWSEPGYLKGDEGGTLFWTIGLLGVYVISATFFSPGMLIARARKTRMQLA